MEAKDDDYWTFIDRKGRYSFDTSLLSKTEISPEEIAIVRKFSYVIGPGRSVPDNETIACFKEALREYSKRYLFNLEHYKRCQLTLIDACTGKEV